MTGRNDEPKTLVAPDGESATASGRVLAHEAGALEDAPMVEAAQLFAGHRQVVIGHNGCRYVLRITKHGKLILNK